MSRRSKKLPNILLYKVIILLQYSIAIKVHTCTGLPHLTSDTEHGRIIHTFGIRTVDLTLTAKMHLTPNICICILMHSKKAQPSRPQQVEMIAYAASVMSNK